MAITVNFPVDRGSDFQADLTLRDDDGTPLNLASFLVEAKFSKNYNSSDKTSFTVEIVNSSGGEIRIKLSPAQTTAMKLHRYVYDVIIKAPINQGGARTRVLEGILYVSPGVT